VSFGGDDFEGFGAAGEDTLTGRRTSRGNPPPCTVRSEPAEFS